MIYMLGFLGLCIGCGLWGPRRRGLAWLVATLAAVLVLLFLLTPYRL
ncbi:MAG: hypothetical protein IVW57_11525 [Ktedonobacterales bacterium]|nr:hypothetical protein [Ktedonobacterales bacterium]